MDAAQSPIAGLIPGLGDVMTSDDPKRKSAAIRQIGQLFVQGAPHFSAAHVKLFDQVLTALIVKADPAARAGLAGQIAPLLNAPPDLVHHLVSDNLIAIAGPLLGRSPLITDPALIDIARMKGQQHLLAISGRAKLAPAITDVIMRRGDREVVRSVAGNAGAAFSPDGYSELLRRADQDGALALAVGQRADISDAQFKDLLTGSVDLVRRRLLATMSPARRDSIGLAKPAGHVGQPIRRDFAQAQKAILALYQSGSLDESVVLDAASRSDHETAVAALAALSGAPIAVIDSLMYGERYDPILVVSRAIGLDWATVRALIVMRPVGTKLTSRAFDDAQRNYGRLLRPTAQRVVNVWRMRQPDMAAS